MCSMCICYRRFKNLKDHIEQVRAAYVPPMRALFASTKGYLIVSYHEEKYDFIKDLHSPHDDAAFSHSAKSFLVVGQLLMGDSILYTSPICPGSVPAEKLDQVQLLLFFKETII